MDVSTIIKRISKGVKKALIEGEALPIDNNYQENMYSEIDIKKPNTKFTIDYVFDDLEQISYEDRQRQYIFPLISLAKGAGYDHKIMFINENESSSYKMINKTEDHKYTVDEMIKIFCLEPWQIKYSICCNGIYIIALIGDLYNNRDAVIKAMESYGWSFSYDDNKCVGSQKWLLLSFEPIFQESVNNEVMINPILKHWTPLYRYGNIIKEGLIPKSDNYMFSYPPKIHLIKGNVNENNIMNIGYKLYDANKNTQNNGHYVLLDVDTRKIKENIDFFYDPRYEHGYYTKQPINKEAISKNKEYIFEKQH